MYVFSQEDSKKMFIEFCRNYLLRAMRNSKQRYIRRERKKINECILNERNAYGNEYANLIVGDIDVDMDQFLKFPENIENEKLYIAFQSLLPIEKEIVTYRLEGYSYKEINELLNFKRIKTSCEIYNRAIRKMRNIMFKNLCEYERNNKNGK